MLYALKRQSKAKLIKGGERHVEMLWTERKIMAKVRYWACLPVCVVLFPVLTHSHSWTDYCAYRSTVRSCATCSMHSSRLLRYAAQACTDSQIRQLVHTACLLSVQVFLVMPLMEGGSLRYQMNQYQTFDEVGGQAPCLNHMPINPSLDTCMPVESSLQEVTRFCAAEIFLGLMGLHEHRILYQDLKPDNVLLDVYVPAQKPPPIHPDAKTRAAYVTQTVFFHLADYTALGISAFPTLACLAS